MAAQTATHAPVDLSELTSSVDAHLFDPELPFRAYCSFPGEAPSTPLNAGDSAVPEAYPMAKVPSPYGSAEPAEPLSSAQEAQRETSIPPSALRSVIAPESSDPAAVSVHPVPFEPIAEESLAELPEALSPATPEVNAETEAEPEAETVFAAEAQPHGLAIAGDEADRIAAMLSRHEPVAAELTVPQPVRSLASVGAPTQAEIDHMVSDVRSRALRYLGSEGHALIEARCQEQAVWLAHRITREIAATLEREIGDWVQQALTDALEKRQLPR